MIYDLDWHITFIIHVFFIVSCSCLHDVQSKTGEDIDFHRLLTAYTPVTFQPDISQQSNEEKNYLLLHKCRDSGEAYSASYLITKEHLLHQFTDHNLSWVNCEMGSFIMMNQRADPRKPNINGTIVQSLDVLDFSVIHLSAYERLQRRWAGSLPREEQNNFEAIHKASNILKEIALETTFHHKHPPSNLDCNRTVVIMPFLGADMGAGHSKLSNRLAYLHACFWSFYTQLPHIVAYVKNIKDYEYARNTSQLPFYDVVLLSDLPKSASLPVATVQQTKARIRDGRWDFDFIFFTESDQILMFRIQRAIFEHLRQYPRRFMSPHRLMPYPNAILTYHHKREVDKHSPYDWIHMNCCMPRQNCGDRKTWISVKNTSVPIINIYGLQVPLGNANFHEETYRTCTLNIYGGRPYCP